MRVAMLTTIDNPFDPFDQWDDWYRFDFEKGYRTCEYLAQIANCSADLSDELNQEETERAIDEIIRFNPLLNYTKVVRDVKEQTIPG